MSNEIIVSIVGVVEGILVFLKLFIDNKKYDEWKNLVNESIADLRNCVNKLNDSDEKKKKAEAFRQQFRNDMNEKASYKINNSDVIPENRSVVSALTEFSKDMADFGIKFFYSDYRKSSNSTEIDFYNYLKVDIDTILYNFLQVLGSGSVEDKAFKSGNRVIQIGLVEFVKTKDKGSKEPDCFSYSELLVMRLIKDGLDEIEFAKVFLTYLDNFFESFKKKYKEFSKLKSYDEHIQKIIDDDVV
jgi:hypothetical protein